MDYREFLVNTWRDMEGNVALGLATGKTAPTALAPNGKLIVNDFDWFAYPSELDLMVQWCEKNSERDAYLTPATYGDLPRMVDERQDGTKTGKKIAAGLKRGRPQYERSKENALACQTIYMDSDACPPTAFRVAPSRHVDTSEGHGHDYWYLSSPIPAHEAAEIAHRITTAHKADGSDPSGWSENKVLRIPTVNTSYDELSPYRVRSEDYTGPSGEIGAVYDALDISGAYDDVEVSEARRSDPLREIAPVPTIEGLPDFETLLSRIPATANNLNDLIFKQPKLGPDGWRSEQRFALLLNLKRFGFTDEETIAVAWHSPAAAKFREDPRGIDGLWWELQQRVIPILDEEGGKSISAAPRRSAEARGPKLLTTFQRAKFNSRSDLITLLNEWVHARLGGVYNRPYAEINSLNMLSILLGESGMIPKDGQDPMPLNLYTFQLGPSSSGKDAHFNFIRSLVRAAYPGDSPDTGNEHSKPALIEDLIARDGMVTWLNGNEFHGKLREIKAGGWTTGIVETWTDIYDGRVPSLGRVGKKELNRPDVTTVAVFSARGTMRGMLEILDKEMFYSGYLARQIWVIADDVPETRESNAVRQIEGDFSRGYNAMPKYFASVFATLRAQLREDLPLGQKRAGLLLTREATKLLEDAKWTIKEHFENNWDGELWATIRRRMSDIIWKVSGLLAMSDGRTVIGTDDMYAALGYAEIWLDNVVLISEKIADTAFSKQCDDIEKFIASRPDGKADIGAIHRFRKTERTDITEGYLRSLVMQGRIQQEETDRMGGPRFYQIKQEDPRG